MKVTPILIIRLPKEFNDEAFNRIAKQVNSKINDYWNFIIYSDVDEIKFEVLNCINCREIDLEELKKELNNNA